MARLLLVDDDPSLLRSVSRALIAASHEVTTAADGAEAVALLAKASFDLVITDLDMPILDGFGVVTYVQKHRPATPVVVVTANHGIRSCVQVMRAGAADFLSKPFHPTELREVIDALLTSRSVPPAQGPTVLASPPPARVKSSSSLALLGDSPALQAVIDLVERVASSPSTVLVTGETGTGKEVVARLLHGQSARANMPFVAVNCGALAESIVESELFGHARGAFTGASDRRTGRFLQANKGTIFLDEIGELTPAVQVKLLRVLQEREITAVGSDRSEKIDVRVVAATHRDLEAMVENGTFRADLFYRLNVVAIRMPPLRERGASDVTALIEFFVEKHRARTGRAITFGPEAMDVLSRYAWPGNVRELENLVEGLVTAAPGPTVRVEDLPRKLRESSISQLATPSSEPSSKRSSKPSSKDEPFEHIGLSDAVSTLERQLIERALANTGGNKNKAAGILGINRTTLVEKMKRLGMKLG